MRADKGIMKLRKLLNVQAVDKKKSGKLRKSTRSENEWEHEEQCLRNIQRANEKIVKKRSRKIIKTETK